MARGSSFHSQQLKIWPWSHACTRLLKVCTFNDSAALLFFPFRASGCTAASTASTRLSSSEYLPPLSPLCSPNLTMLMFLLSRSVFAYSWGVHFGPHHLFCYQYTVRVTLSGRTTFPLRVGLDLQTVWSCCRFVCSRFSSGRVCQVFIKGGL